MAVGAASLAARSSSGVPVAACVTVIGKGEKTGVSLMPMVTVLLIGLSSTVALVQVEPTRGLFVDDAGRVQIFHGLNAVYKLSPWFPELNGTDPRNSLSEADMTLLHEWGFNLLRLGVMWEGAEPDSINHPGTFNGTYLSIMRGLVDRLGEYGIYTLADMHEDSLSRFYCGEGIPDAYLQPNSTGLAFPFPLPIDLPAGPGGYPNLTTCQEINFALYLFTVQEQASWGNLFTNATFSHAFNMFWNAVGSVFVGSESLLGYELINEPQAGNLYENPLDYLVAGIADTNNLLPLYEAAYGALRTADSDHIVFYEHAVTEAYFLQNTGFTAGPGGAADNHKQALSYHMYCINQNSTGDITNVTACAETLDVYWSIERANKAKVAGGSLLSEFGAVGPHESSAEAVSVWGDLCDTSLESWAYWTYKSYDDITTQNPATETLYNLDGTVQLLKLAALSRTYAQMIAGVPLSIAMAFNTTTQVFTLSYTINTQIEAPLRVTRVYYNGPLHYPSGVGYLVLPAGSAMVNATEPNYLVFTHNATATGPVHITVYPTP